MKWLAPVQKAFEVPRGVMIFPFRPSIIGSRSALASPLEILSYACWDPILKSGNCAVPCTRVTISTD